MYLFLFVLKVLKILLEKYMDHLTEDMLQRNTVSCIVDLGLFVSTLGAPDFLEFLLSYCIDVGISIAEKIYLERLCDSLIDIVIDKVSEF